MEAIFTRCSIQIFTNEPVSDEQITKILMAAIAVPSARNEQP